MSDMILYWLRDIDKAVPHSMAEETINEIEQLQAENKQLRAVADAAVIMADEHHLTEAAEFFRASLAALKKNDE